MHQTRQDVTLCEQLTITTHNDATAKIRCISNSYTVHMHYTIRFMMTDEGDGHQGLMLIALLK